LIEGKSLEDAVKEASIGRVRPKIMTASTAILGLLPLLVLRLHGTEIERPLAIVMVGGLLTSTCSRCSHFPRSTFSCTE
jgi:cobalt-zinc-cadmium resistance protein CzcA